MRTPVVHEAGYRTSICPKDTKASTQQQRTLKTLSQSTEPHRTGRLPLPLWETCI